jgi:hypothetical protein
MHMVKAVLREMKGDLSRVPGRAAAMMAATWAVFAALQVGVGLRGPAIHCGIAEQTRASSPLNTCMPGKPVDT